MIRLVFCRRRPKAFAKNLIWKMQGITGLQFTAWQQILTGWKAARNAAAKYPEQGTVITITHKTENEGAVSELEWMIVDLSNVNNPADEDKQYEDCKIYFKDYSYFKTLVKKIASEKLPDTSFLTKPFKSRYFNTDLKRKFDEVRMKGEEEIGEKSLASIFLSLGIMSHLGRYDSLEDAENAFIQQEKDMLEEAVKEGATIVDRTGNKINPDGTRIEP